tara:strand:- start:221 stop:448 length:228 start_codon:yes stop_codon:yes gene_type:complete
MKKEIVWGNVVFSFGKIDRHTNYICDDENEFWEMYDYLTKSGIKVTAWIRSLTLSHEERVPVEEYRREMNGDEEE